MTTVDSARRVAHMEEEETDWLHITSSRSGKLIEDRILYH
jgi:hypothetical protein